ncbi:MAG: hypothetical protein K8F62_00465, partial [Pseudorhodoplanes sp.]|nr:hypothetical protein [Pseudorhodoplanes sp.]
MAGSRRPRERKYLSRIGKIFFFAAAMRDARRMLRFVQIETGILTLPEHGHVFLRMRNPDMAIQCRKRAARRRERNRALWAGAVLILICAGSLYMA